MLLRARQIESLSAVQHQQFARRVLGHIREQFREHYLVKGHPDASVLKFIADFCEYAQTHGIVTELGVVLFMDAFLAVAPRSLLSICGLQAVLEDMDLDGQTKARKICDRAILFLEETMDDAGSWILGDGEPCA